MRRQTCLKYSKFINVEIKFRLIVKSAGILDIKLIGENPCFKIRSIIVSDGVF